MTTSLHDTTLVPVTDASHVGGARRVAVTLAERLGFDEVRRGQIAIVATEAANNLVRHGGGGQLILRPLARGDVAGFELLAIDSGKGIANVTTALQDGYSTGGTSGTGLGAIRRLSNEFDVFSMTRPPAASPATGLAPGTFARSAAPRAHVPHASAGTVLLSRFWNADATPPPPAGIETGVVCLPLEGESACGDAWCVHAHPDGRWTAIIADGLGHGLLAAGASRQALRLFEQNVDAGGTVRILQALHAGMRGTRGAAVSVVEINPDRRDVKFGGVGNVAGVIVTPTAARNMVSHNGTLGAEARRFQEFVYPLNPTGGDDDALLVMHSDGLATHWNLADYPGLRNRHPAVIAGVLYRDHRRTRDDVSVLVARLDRPSPGRGTP